MKAEKTILIKKIAFYQKEIEKGKHLAEAERFWRKEIGLEKSEEEP